MIILQQSENVMELNEFREWAHRFADWMADYYERIEDFPVKSKSMPGEILDQLPETPPERPQPMADILADFENILLPGITHWQSPGFFAYFPANASFPSILAEMLTSALGAQCMIWETSPAAAELEERVMVWLKQMLGLPPQWDGVIQDTASTATLSAILSARENISHFEVNETGLKDYSRLRVYCSTETHSSVEKAVKIAGLGRENLVKVGTDGSFRMDAPALEAAIALDLQEGFTPCCVIATIGTTGVTAIDPIDTIGEICRRYAIWLHIDAAYGGAALVLPEYRWMIKGAECADSLVFNPHKWMFTNFDCSAYFVKDKESLIRTFEILPEYLKTASRGKVNDYRDWGIPLGRRFRALKLWMVIRCYGLSGIQQAIRKHLELASWFENQVKYSGKFELMAPRTLSVICFRYHPDGVDDEATLNRLNQELLERINGTGRAYLTHTRVRNTYTIRMSIAQTHVEKRHVEGTWNLIVEQAGLWP